MKFNKCLAELEMLFPGWSQRTPSAKTVQNRKHCDAIFETLDSSEVETFRKFYRQTMNNYLIFRRLSGIKECCVYLAVYFISKTRGGVCK
jgi:hypothetical protein